MCLWLYITAVTGDRDQNCMQQTSLHKHMLWLPLSRQSQQLLLIDSSKDVACIDKQDNSLFSNVCLWLYVTAVSDDGAQ